MNSTTLSLPTRRERRAVSRRRWSVMNLVIAALLFAGIATLLYPTTATWFTDTFHAADVAAYSEEVAALPDAERQALLEQAREYNENLPDGPLRDPYTLNEQGGADSIEAGRDDYNAQLSIRPGDAMARVRIPKLKVDIPIYHGTADDILEKGIGHLYGSGLPVGGKGNHSVLTGHSGLPGSTLFTHLNELEDGDIFYIEVMGETLAYKVDNIVTVEPDSGDDLRQVQGKDYVTLLTCTPIGVNTHRLLVRGERIPLDEAPKEEVALAAASNDPGFPWWALGLAAGLALAVYVAVPRRPRPAAASAGDDDDAEGQADDEGDATGMLHPDRDR